MLLIKMCKYFHCIILQMLQLFEWPLTYSITISDLFEFVPLSNYPLVVIVKLDSHPIISEKLNLINHEYFLRSLLMPPIIGGGARLSAHWLAIICTLFWNPIWAGGSYGCRYILATPAVVQVDFGFHWTHAESLEKTTFSKSNAHPPLKMSVCFFHFNRPRYPLRTNWYILPLRC